MRCERCDQADRRPAKRAKLAERDGRVAVVLGRKSNEGEVQRGTPLHLYTDHAVSEGDLNSAWWCAVACCVFASVLSQAVSCRRRDGL